MGLQLWLPLNGNIRNQGLCDVEIDGNPNSWENGKIGKCAKFNGGQWINTEKTDLFSYTDNLTWTCWIIPNYQSRNQWAFTCGRADAGGYGYGLQIHSAAECRIWFGNRAYSINTINDTWQHIAFTKKGNNIRIYLNGECVINTTFTGNLPTWSDGHFGIGIGCFHYSGELYHCNSSINDFRLYDTALSAREIREIYNNPIVHFPMNNVYELGITNKYSGNFAEGYLYTGDYITRTKLPDERGYNYKLSYTGNGDSYWTQINIGNSFSFTAGKTYYYSCKARCHSKTNVGLYFRAARSDNDWATNSVNVLNDDGRWHEYVISQTINETYDKSGSTITCHPYVEFYTRNMNENGTTYAFDVDIKDIQVTADRYYPFIANELVDSTISDTSGYCNNGMVEGGTSPQSVSQLVSQSSITLPRYSSQYYFSGKDYIKFQNPFYGQQLSQLTINFFVNISEGCGQYATIFSIYGGGVDNRCPWIAVNCEGAGLWGYVSGSNNYLYGSGGYLEYNTWYMATFVFKDGKAQWYLDGQKNIEPTTFSAGLITFTDVPTLSIGNSYRGTTWTTNFVGYLSDFRMYANALTETDIKRLYNTSASLDSQGNLMLSGEVIE